MPQVFVSVGSNVAPQQSLGQGLQMMRSYYGALQLSPVYRNRPVGFEGEDFFNLALSMITYSSPQAVRATLVSIEDACGRNRRQPRFSSRTLDLDVLLYGDEVIDDGELQVPREELLDAAFVLRPMADLAPELMHPTEQRSMRDLWAAFDQAAHPMQQAELALEPGA